MKEVQRSGDINAIVVVTLYLQMPAHRWLVISFVLDIEKDLSFLCVVNFQNTMKKDTPNVISEVCENRSTLVLQILPH